MKTASPPRAFTPLTLVLGLLLFSAVLVPLIAWQYSYMPLFGLAAAAGTLLLLVTAAGVWFLARRPRRWLAPSRLAVRVGLVGGLLWALEIGLNNFLAPSLPARDIIDDSFWALIALTIFLLAAGEAYRANSLRAGLGSGLWSGLVSGVGACAMALSVIVFGMYFLLHDPLNLAEWAAGGPASGAPSMAAYFAFETLAGAFLHLTVLGLGMGALLGLVGGLLGKAAHLVTRFGRRT